MSDREVCARGTLNDRPTEIVRYDKAGKFYAEWEGVDESGRRRQQINLNEAIERTKTIVGNGGQHFAGAARRLDRGLGWVQ